MKTMNGFDRAIIGVGRRCGEPTIVVYDYEECTDVLMMRDGMTYEEACEYLDYNVIGTWVGPDTPIFVERMTLDEIQELEE